MHRRGGLRGSGCLPELACRLSGHRAETPRGHWCEQPASCCREHSLPTSSDDPVGLAPTLWLRPKTAGAPQGRASLPLHRELRTPCPCPGQGGSQSQPGTPGLAPSLNFETAPHPGACSHPSHLEESGLRGAPSELTSGNLTALGSSPALSPAEEQPRKWHSLLQPPSSHLQKGAATSKGCNGATSDTAQWSVSLQFSRSVLSNSLHPHGLQHARPPCP